MPINVTEREWARSHFRLYLLDRMDDEAAERMEDALAEIPDLVYDLDDAEEHLIDEALNGRLAAEDQADFDRVYVNGPEDNQVRLKVRQALLLPEARVGVEPQPVERVVPIRRPFPVQWVVAALAASILVCVFGLLWYRALNENRKMQDELARLRSTEKGTNEQQAGESRDGLLLPSTAPGSRLTVAAPPTRLIWGPVPDYRSEYRIRVRGGGGRVMTSTPLTPRDNAIEYVPAEQPPLPWEVSVLGPGGVSEVELARYSVVQR